MSLPTKKIGSLNELLGYSLPKLHTGKSWYIDFTVYDPLTEKMKRKKYSINSKIPIRERRKLATEAIVAITNRLRSGWNPWAETSSSRQYTKFADVVDLYNKYLLKLQSTGAIKENTVLDYQKRIRVLSAYNSQRIPSIVYIYQLDQSYCSDFLDYVLIDRDSSARTRNNYRIWLSSFCSWLEEKQYLDSNPVSKIKSLAADQKKRSEISHSDLTKLRSYLLENNPHFLLLCQFLYYTLIRPGELSNIRLRDINLMEQKVIVSSAISKNRKDGTVGLNDALIKSMLDLNVFAADNDCYLFGKDFKPSPEKGDNRTYRNYFNRVREALKFPDSYQLYSLKDSGINDLANAEGIVIARDQARHADVSTTNKYLCGRDRPVHEQTKSFKGLL